jgi:glutathionyl-hydroquinone reductase
MLIEGRWVNDVEDTPGLRRRRGSEKKRWFRDRVTAHGSSGFKAKPGRYHLYVSYACPWAHRAILYRNLKGLQGVISMSVLHPRWAGPYGWTFSASDMSTVDHAGGRRYLYEVYQAAKPDFTGKVTVPVLWDKQAETIVNNESGEIIRMLNSEFNAWAKTTVDFHPPAFRRDIDAMNAIVLDKVCLGVYKAGFAANQAEYDKAVHELFNTLGELEDLVSRQPYLLGEQITESDWHLFCTLCRFDVAYYGALKCNLRRLIDYPALSAYARRLHEYPGVAETVRIDHVKRHYYDALGELHREIMPAGPAVDYRTTAQRHPIHRSREAMLLHAFADRLRG